MNEKKRLPMMRIALLETTREKLARELKPISPPRDISEEYKKLDEQFNRVIIEEAKKICSLEKKESYSYLMQQLENINKRRL